MEYELTIKELEHEMTEQEKEMTPVCIDARKKAKKASRLAHTKCSKNLNSFSPFSNFFSSKMPCGGA